MSTVALVGTGLIGGSLGLALRRAGVKVRGWDADAATLERACDRGVVDLAAGGLAEVMSGADVAFVATPVSGVVEAVAGALAAGVGAVTDVGSVKAPVVRGVEAASPGGLSRFVGGHPMAGSDRDGVDGADPDLFAGSTWVLTPTERTDPAAFTAVRHLVAATGAEIVAVPPDLHDALVAIVSHLPHLMSATLMGVATEASPNQDTLFRLAAGGFRSMTRLSHQAPGIWPDICVENRTAIVAALDHYLAALARARELVAGGEREPLLGFLEHAQTQGRQLPARVGVAGPLVQLEMPVPDRPGVLAEVTTLAGRHGVNIADLEISHGSAGGVLAMVVPADGADPVVAGLESLGYRVTRRMLA
ncbi:MAG: prephenate dehydrogenase/arogenate dehydrogenase family protein [Acidimicrobiia bacterium]